MRRKKKIKMQLHHQIGEDWEITEHYSAWSLLWRPFQAIGSFFFQISYATGYILMSLFTAPFKFLSLATKPRSLYDQIILEQKAKNSRVKTLGVFSLLLIIALVPVLSLNLISQGKQLTGRVLGLSDTAISSLEAAQTALKDQNFELAEANFSQTLYELEQAEAALDEASLALKTVMGSLPESYNANEFLETAKKLTTVGRDGTETLAMLNSIKISPQGFTGDPPMAQLLPNAVSKANNIEKSLKESHQFLQSVNPAIIPEQYLQQFVEIKSLVAELHKQTLGIGDLVNTVANLLLGEKTFLAVMQNNNELRATGGFIGTIGQGKIINGGIKELDIRSVYDLDGQLKDKITVPKPLIAVNDRLYLRDSNWLADFPSSAKTLSVMYEKEGGETPDIVLALTPDLFIELLRFTGDVTLPSYGQVISPDNFIEQIQTSTSVYYDKSLNQPKQLLADLYPALMQGLDQKKDTSLLEILQIFQRGLSNKQMLIYSRDPQIQAMLSKLNWTGELHNSDRDYLAVVSTNLSGTKTDRSLNRNLALETRISSEGNIKNTIRYTVQNPLPATTGLQNISFVRFLVPENSKLIAAYGLENIELPDYETVDYTGLIDIDNWNQNISYNQTNFAYSGKESGKQWFGGWVEVNGGEEQTMVIEYELPYQLNKIDRYSIVTNHQPGLNMAKFNHLITWEGKYQLVWNKTPLANANQSGNQISYEAPPNQDFVAGVILER